MVLQHRALWSDQGGTWGVPGGARMPGETAEDAALREAAEEAGIDRQGVRLRESAGAPAPRLVLHDGARRRDPPVHPAVTDAESVELRWVPLDEVPALPLLPAFADAWPRLRERIEALGGR